MTLMFDAVGALLFVIGACGLLLQWHETRTESRRRARMLRTNLEISTARQSRNGRRPPWWEESPKWKKG